MKFSILIPAYNEEKYIKGCVDSVLATGYKDMEIWICDDCSTDNTTYIIGKLGEKENVYCYWNTKNEGRSASMNNMLGKCHGEIILKLDADMEIVSKDIFEKLEKIYEDPKVGGVAIFGHTKEIEEKQKGIAKLEYLLYNIVDREKEKMLPIHGLCELTRPLDIHCWRKNLVPGIPSDIIHDDGYAALEVLRQGYSIVNGNIIINHLKPPMTIKEMFKVRNRGRKGWKQLRERFNIKVKWGGL
jgi:glycosyltransferase involved in cell wall biosynthesis